MKKNRVNKPMPKLSLLLVHSIRLGLILLLVTCTDRPPASPVTLPDPPTEIFLCIGQSNMSGRATMLAGDTLAMAGVWLLDSAGQWEPARNPLNKYSSIRKILSMQQIGPAYGFALVLREQRPDLSIGLVVNARGGSSIKEWQAGTPYFKDAVARIRQALAQGGELKAILWHQGEADMQRSQTYMAGLIAMVSAFRTAFNNDTLLFIAGQVGTWPAEADSINAVLMSIEDHIPHSACIQADGLEHMGEFSHFTRESQLILGKRYAEVVFAKLYSH